MRIESKKELRAVVEYEKSIYSPNSFIGKILFALTQNERFLFYRYLKYLRYEEYHICRGKSGRVAALYYGAKKNRLGNIINVKIVPLYTGKGINIHHQGVIINGYIGDDCVFHGNNCLGNNNKTEDEIELIPTVGSRVEFGYGSMVIGGVKIADDVVIGAGAVVVKDVDCCNATVVGVPAKIVGK